MTIEVRQANTKSVVYGELPEELADRPPDALQVSPLLPGARSLEAVETGTLERALIGAPPGTIERRFVLAHALRSLKRGGALIALAPKAKGGARIAAELEAFGCETASAARRHFRIVKAVRPEQPTGIDAAIAEGALRFDQDLGFWTQPGVFSSDRVDRGSRLLLDHLPAFSGRGADLGCGIGVLGRAALQSAAVAQMTFIDLDRRALDAARRNVGDTRAAFRWADLKNPQADLQGLDFVVTNPPFHDGGAEDRALGQVFIRCAAEMLRKGGTLRLVANRHLPYEAALAQAFTRVSTIAEENGYKLFEARR